jgi:hypothetical protein
MGIKEALEIVPVFQWLDELRDSGSVNMFGAAPLVADEFGLDRKEARRITVMWMETFDHQRSPKERAIVAVAREAE